jgi:hypothetical protein
MRGHITEIALAATLATTLISATPALARDGQTSLSRAARHDFAWPRASDAWAKRNHNYGRGFSQRAATSGTRGDTGTITTAPWWLRSHNSFLSGFSTVVANSS